MRPLAPASSARERSRVNVSPVLALAGLAAIGLLATRLPRPAWPRVVTVDPVLAAGGPLVAVGLVLGPGIGFLSPTLLGALAPVTALALGWLGAMLGARFEWRYLRRVPREVWLCAALSAVSAFVAAALSVALLARLVPALGAAWTPRLPAVLTLAAVAAASGPGAVRLVARTLGLGELITRRITRVAVLETAAGTLALTVPLALHRPYAGTNAELGWLASLVFAVGGGALVGMAFLSVSRLRPGAADLGFALVATLLFGAGLGYAADLSPLIVCALAAGLIVNTSTQRRVVREMLADWAHPLTAVLLIVTGALLTLPTAWILVAAPLVALVRVAAKWGAVRLGRDILRLHGVPPHAGLATVAQGATALALGVNFFMMYGARAPGVVGGAAVLATVLGAVAVAQLAAPPLLTLALRAGPARLTPAPETAELSPR
jgi:hypothetical protein